MPTGGSRSPLLARVGGRKCRLQLRKKRGIKDEDGTAGSIGDPDLQTCARPCQTHGVGIPGCMREVVRLGRRVNSVLGRGCPLEAA
jgi:hypothetical protein